MSWTDDDVVKESAPAAAWTDADIAEAPKPTTNSELLRQQMGPSDFTKAFASTPARMLKSTMQMLGAGDYVPDAVSNAAAEGDKSILGRIAGDVAGTGGIRAGAGGLVNAIQKLNAAKGFVPAVARTAEAAGYGAAQGAVTSPDQQADAAKWGAGGGAGAQMLGRVASGLVRPTAEARTLMDQGIALTPGQSAGKGSAFGKIEELASSNPITSLAVQPARRRAMEEFNLTAVNQVIKDITGSPVPKGTSPREAVEQAADLISKQYDSSLGSINASADDVRNHVLHSLNFAISENPMMLPKDAKHLSRYVNERLAHIPQTLTGEQLKHVDREIGDQARRMAQSALASDQAAAPAWYELQAGLRNAMEAGATGDAAAQLNRANAAFRHLLPVRKALAGNDMMTPRRLRQTIEAMQQQGNHPSADLTKAAEATLPGTIPNSGTAERLLANAIPSLLLGGGAGAQSLGWDTVGTGMMAAGALGSRTGSRFMTGSLPAQQAAAAAIRALRRGAGPAANALTRKPQSDE